MHSFLFVLLVVMRVALDVILTPSGWMMHLAKTEVSDAVAIEMYYLQSVNIQCPKILGLV